MERAHRLRLFPLVIAMGVAAAAAGGCGDVEESSGGTAVARSSDADVPAGVREAKAFVHEHLEPPTSIGLDEPLPARPEPGKRVAYLQCAAPVCASIGKAVTEASEALGWNVTSTPTGATPESIAKAWDAALQSNPDAVIQGANPRVLVEKQLKQLEAKGIPYVGNAVAEERGGAEIAIVSDGSTYEERGQWLARWVVADTEGRADAVFFSVPDFPIVTALQKGFETEYERLCPECKLTVVDVPLTAIGTQFPAQVVSTVQRDPDINYLIPGYGDMTLGVPQALRAANLAEQVEIVSQAGQPSNFGNIEQGLETANVPYPDNEAGWMLVDAVARHFAGVELPHDAYLATLSQYLTKDTIEDPAKNWIGVQDYKEQFKKLWKVG